MNVNIWSRDEEIDIYMDLPFTPVIGHVFELRQRDGVLSIYKVRDVICKMDEETNTTFDHLSIRVKFADWV